MHFRIIRTPLARFTCARSFECLLVLLHVRCVFVYESFGCYRFGG